MIAEERRRAAARKIEPKIKPIGRYIFGGLNYPRITAYVCDVIRSWRIR